MFEPQLTNIAPIPYWLGNNMIDKQDASAQNILWAFIRTSESPESPVPSVLNISTCGSHLCPSPSISEHQSHRCRTSEFWRFPIFPSVPSYRFRTRQPLATFPSSKLLSRSAGPTGKQAGFMAVASNDMAMVRLVITILLLGLTRSLFIPFLQTAAPSDPSGSPSSLPTSSPFTVAPHVTTPRSIIICLPTTSALASGPVQCKDLGVKLDVFIPSVCARCAIACRTAGCSAKNLLKDSWERSISLEASRMIFWNSPRDRPACLPLSSTVSWKLTRHCRWSANTKKYATNLAGQVGRTGISEISNTQVSDDWINLSLRTKTRI